MYSCNVIVLGLKLAVSALSQKCTIQKKGNLDKTLVNENVAAIC